MFRPIDYNALDQEFRTGKPLSMEIRRWIVGLCLSGERQRKISRLILMGECVASFVIIKHTAYVFLYRIVQIDEA